MLAHPPSLSRFSSSSGAYTVSLRPLGASRVLLEDGQDLYALGLGQGNLASKDDEGQDDEHG